MDRSFTLQSQKHSHRINFNAMASPCEIIFDAMEPLELNTLAEKITQEVWRIEDKYSRYKPLSLCSTINNSQGQPVLIDEETFALLTFADQCYQMSDGLFDITSGVLRKAWHFDGSDHIPSDKKIQAILPWLDWTKVSFNAKEITLPQHMEIDFGGIGKEYAVDKIGELIKAHTPEPALINFGGDLLATKPRTNKTPWSVGIEHPAFKNQANTVISFFKGGIATSGDANRFLIKDKKRYGHILNVKTGWPIEKAPRSITVASETCLKAGMVATLAMLQGESAEDFLTDNEFKHWIFRD